MQKQFHIADLLSITTDRLAPKRDIERASDVLDFMTEQSLDVRDMPEAKTRCVESLFKQHPFLETLTGVGVSEADWEQWLDKQAVEFGTFLNVHPITTY